MSMQVYVTCESCALLIDAELIDKILKNNGLYDGPASVEYLSSAEEIFDGEYDDPCEGYRLLCGFTGNIETDNSIIDLVDTPISEYCDGKDVRLISSDNMPMLFKSAYGSVNELIEEYQKKVLDAFDVVLSDSEIVKRLVNIEGWRIA